MTERGGGWKLLLASASPRRAEILSRAGIPFEKITIDFSAFEKSLSAVGVEPRLFAEKSASGKLEIALKECGAVNGVILCADTIVALDGEIYGKPEDVEDADRMLRALSGREHEVVTACAMADVASGAKTIFHISTSVEFYALPKETILGYIATGEPMDKAGAYGIQGKASVFVKRINGCYDNVVGLPVSAVAKTLRNEFNISIESCWKKN